MWVLGITGGIGSGKTAATNFFEQQGVVVVDADIVAREVVEPGEPAWQAIKDKFGSVALLSDHSLNRAWLRQHVFDVPEDRLWLEQQTHPRIRERIIHQLETATSPYAILASPLLFESGQAQLVQRTLVIDVSEATQVERASQRDHNHAEQIRKIIAAQMARTDRCSKADDIVDNSGSLADLQQQLARLHKHYLELAQA